MYHSTTLVAMHQKRAKLPSPQINSPFQAFHIRQSSQDYVSPHKASTATFEPLPEAFPIPRTATIPNTSRHILLGNYPLIKDKTGPPRIPSSDEIKLVQEIFSSVFEVSVNATFMIVRCTSLPAKPWPITIGGIPLWLTNSPNETPMAQGRMGHSAPVLPNLGLSRVICPEGEKFALIAKYFAENHAIVVTEIMWNGTQLHIKVPDTAEISTLPVWICKIMVLYSTTSTILNHREFAKRPISPTSIIRDDTNYARHLRPGSMLSCGVQGGDERLTSSGVIVQDREGEKWLTVASDGFPLGNETVHHPNANYPVIGNVERIFSETDISLVKLRSDITYASQTFASDEQQAMEITYLRKPSGLRTGDILRMENGFSGYCEGVYIESIWTSVPIDEGREEMPWIVLSNFYCGNGLDEPLEGSCGSPVLTDDGEVVGMFRFMADNGRAYCGSVELLIKCGFTLSSIP